MDGVLGVAPAFASPRHADLDMAATVRELHKGNTSHKPLALLLYGDEAACRAQCRELAREPDVACFDTLEEAVMGLAATWRYHRFRECGGAAESLALPAAAGRQARDLAGPGRGAGGGGPGAFAALPDAHGAQAPDPGRRGSRGLRPGGGLSGGAEDHLAGMAA